MSNEHDLKSLNEPSVEFFILADRAEAVNGKLYIMGGAWDRQFVVDFKQPVFVSFAIGIRVPWNATNQDHKLRLTIESADGKPVEGFLLEAGFVAGRPPWAKQGESQRALLAIPVVPVMFPGPGSYLAKANVDDSIDSSIEFQMMSVSAPVVQFGAPPQP